MKTFIKKYLAVVLLPYICFFNLIFFLGSGAFKEWSIVKTVLLFSMVGLINLTETIGLIIQFIILIKNLLSCEWNKLNIREIAVIKLLQIPAYILFFIIGFSTFFLPLGFIITIFCYALDVWSIIVSGAFTCIGLISEKNKNKINKKQMILHGIISFIFCFDVIDAIILRKKLK